MSVPPQGTESGARRSIALATGTFHAIFALLRSFGLASALFLGLLLLTYLGTLDQIEFGIHHAQQKYFHAFLVLHPVFGMPVPLPGAYLLMVLLCVNITLGALLRIRKGWAQAGMLMVHSGILVLLAGAFVNFHYAFDGQMTLHKDESVSHFTSARDWEVVLVAPDAAVDAPPVVVPGSAFMDLRGAETRAWELPNLPFSLEFANFQPNAALIPAGPMVPAASIVAGHFLDARPEDTNLDHNFAGLHLRVIPSDVGTPQDVLLWALKEAPADLAMPGGTWRAELRRQQWPLPFSLTLREFTREIHPGTEMPRAFSSVLTRRDGDIEERVRITMNDPMRYKGYVFYQSSWGPQNAGPGVDLYSILTVSRNPADRFPLYACAFIALGMAVHFATKLTRYIRRESTGRVS